MSPNEKAISIPLNLPNINVEYKTNINRKSGEIWFIAKSSDKISWKRTTNNENRKILSI